MGRYIPTLSHQSSPVLLGITLAGRLGVSLRQLGLVKRHLNRDSVDLSSGPGDVTQINWSETSKSACVSILIMLRVQQQGIRHPPGIVISTV